MKYTRASLLFIAALITLLCGTNQTRAQAGAKEFQDISLKQIMGQGWTDFERTFAALMADPPNDQAFGELSIVVGEAGATNKVAPYLEMLVKQRPDDMALRTVLGRVYKDMIRDPVRAREHFEAVLKRDADDFFVHYQVGAMLGRQGDKAFADAVRHYRAAAEKVPRQYADLRTHILEELGDLLYSRREANAQYVQEAMGAWDAMTTGVRRFDLATYEELAGQYRARSLWPKVQETYERYFEVLREIKDTPDNVTRCRLKTRIAEACENQGLYPKAIEAYNEAISLLDENTWQRRKLEASIRQCHLKINESAAYESQLRKAVQDNPNSIQAMQSLARMLLANGRSVEAALLLEAARKLAPRHVPLLNALEGIYRASGQDEALANILRARIELSPEDFSAYVDLAQLHIHAKRTPQAQEVLSELEASPSQLPEKYLLLARAYARYGLAKRAFVLYKRLADASGPDALSPNDAKTAHGATSEQRLEFCDFCLSQEEFADQASPQAAKLCDEGSLDAAGYVGLAAVFSKHGKNDVALGLLVRGLSACGKGADGRENRQAVFTLNLAMSDLEHRMGAGHHAQAIGSTLKALLAAPDLHFKQALNDRLITLLTNYGHREKLLYSAQEEADEAIGTTMPASRPAGPGRTSQITRLGGPRGAGVAPWIDFLNIQANSREDVDLWMLLGQIHEAVDVDVEFWAKATSQSASAPAPKRIKTDLAQARLWYQKVIDTEFQNLDAHLAMARVLADPTVDEYEKAVNELEVLSLLNPAIKWESTQGEGDLYAVAGESALAREKWQAAVEQSASEPDLLAQAAMRMFRAGDLKQAMDLAQRTASISPYVFSYRTAYASLLAQGAAGEAGTDMLARCAAETASALGLAQASPSLADFVPRLTSSLLEARTLLARRYFAQGDFKAAKEQFDSVCKLVKATSLADTGAFAAAAVQVARCTEALGDRSAARQQYEDVLKDQPDISCWLSSGLTVSGRTFLMLKRDGELNEAPRETSTKPASRPVAATTLAQLDVSDDIRGILAAPGGKLYIEGARCRHVVDTAARKLVRSVQRSQAMGQGPTTILPLPNDLSLVVHGEDVRAIRSEDGQVVWTKTPGGPSEQNRLGRIDSVKATDQVVVVGYHGGLQVIGADKGQPIWDRAGAGTTFDVNGHLVALLAPTDKLGKEWLTMESATGKVIARKAFAPRSTEGTFTGADRAPEARPASILWYPPVLTGEISTNGQDRSPLPQMVLLTDSLGGSVYGFNARTGQECFTFTPSAAVISPPMVVGNTVFLHTLVSGTVHVVAMDIRQLKVRFDVPLQAGKTSVNVLHTPPLLWKASGHEGSSQGGIDIKTDRILYLDSKSGAMIAIDTATGSVQTILSLDPPGASPIGPVAAKKIFGLDSLEVAPLGDIAAKAVWTPGSDGGRDLSTAYWTLCGDTLCLAGSHGQLWLVKLSLGN